MNLTLGDYATLAKGSTIVQGIINGIKLSEGDLERVSIEELDIWLYFNDGWKFIIEEEEEEENAEI